MAIPVDQDICHKTGQRHQYWIGDSFRELDRERRQRIWRGWSLMGRYGDGEVRMGDII